MRYRILAVCLPLVLLSMGAFAQYSLRDFSKLSVMTGAWREPHEDGMLYEVWERASDSLLLGRSFIVSGKDTIPQETVRLSLRAGSIIYSPLVSGQNSGQRVDFILNRLDDSGFLFKNPAHDFPQRIRYRPSGNTLLATVSGPTSKGYREVQYSYTRAAGAACDAIRYFAGHWRLKAWSSDTAGGTPDIEADWRLHPSGGGNACLSGHVVLSSGDTFTNEQIAYDRVRRVFTRTISANDGSAYSFTTKGWAGNKITWLGIQKVPGAVVGIKQEITRKDNAAFSAVFYTRQKGQWVVVMREELERVSD